ncbi:MAG: hypothetical protein HC844_03935 [Tabrizicola sp.]|nr:hypothetical protein [Tabrizicola sp.]
MREPQAASRGGGTDRRAPPEPVAAGGRRSIELIAAAISVVWLIGSVTYLFRSTDEAGNGSRDIGTVLLVVIVPLILVWLIASMMRSTRQLRDEAARLHQTVNVLKASYIQMQDQAERSAGKTAAGRRTDGAQPRGAAHRRAVLGRRNYSRPRHSSYRIK